MSINTSANTLATPAVSNLLVSGNVNVDKNDTYNLGSNSLAWDNIYCENLEANNISGDITFPNGNFSTIVFPYSGDSERLYHSSSGNLTFDNGSGSSVNVNVIGNVIMNSTGNIKTNNMQSVSGTGMIINDNVQIGTGGGTKFLATNVLESTTASGTISTVSPMTFSANTLLSTDELNSTSSNGISVQDALFITAPSNTEADAILNITTNGYAVTLESTVSGDSFSTFVIDQYGSMFWGNGTGNADVGIKRTGQYALEFYGINGNIGGGAMTLTLQTGSTLNTDNINSGGAASGVNFKDSINIASGKDLSIASTTNQIVLGSTNTTTISSTAPSASRTYTIPDAGGNTNFILGTSSSGQTINGGLTLGTALASGSGGTGTTTSPTSGQILVGTSGGSYVPYTLASGTGISTTVGSGTLQINNTGVTTFSAGTTGLTPSSATTGAVTLGGKLAVANGGTNSSTALNNGYIMVSSSGSIIEGTSSSAPTFSGTVTANQLNLQSTAVIQASTLPFISGSSSNNSFGVSALASLTSGSSNVACGYKALNAITNASSNTAVGHSALTLNTTNNNTALGYEALFVNTTGPNNTAIGYLAGGANTVNGNNTYVGYSAGSTVNAGANTVLGSNAMGNASSGSGQNVAVGYQAAYNCGNNGNGVFIGYQAGYGCTGIDCTYIGYESGGNTSNNQSGNYNTAVGQNTLFNITVGVNNAAYGNSALSNLTSGCYNVGYGANSLSGVTSGSYNNAIGQFALSSITTGIYNCSLGYNAGGSAANGSSSNVYINNAGATESNTMRIGSGTGTGNQNLNAVYIAGIYGISGTGNTVVCTSSGQLVAPSSSIRYKENVKPLGDYTDDLIKLNPVMFNYKSDEKKEQYFGLIAEEVAEIYPDLIVKDKDGNIDGVQYNQMIPLLLNELIKLRKRVCQLETGRVIENYIQ